jgi:hypothetical protein
MEAPDHVVVMLVGAGPGELPRADLDDVWTRIVRLRRLVLPQHDVLTRLGTGDKGEPDAARGLRNAATCMSQVGTAFIGQNLGWMVDRIDGMGDFIVLGIVFRAVVVAGLLVVFWRKRWL